MLVHGSEQRDLLFEPGRELKRLSSLINEVASVKNALLALENKQAADSQQLSATQRPEVSLPLPAHTDSFDYGAQTGHAKLLPGEWSKRNAHDNRLNMIPDPSTLHAINKHIVASECVAPDCITRSGLPLGAVLYPERGECKHACPRATELSHLLVRSRCMMSACKSGALGTPASRERLRLGRERKGDRRPRPTAFGRLRQRSLILDRRCQSGPACFHHGLWGGGAQAPRRGSCTTRGWYQRGSCGCGSRRLRRLVLV